MVLIIIALILIIPLFLPATVEITSQKEIMLTPAQVFHHAASYTDRNLWDPWLETEPEAGYTIVPQPDYVGSTYTWNGKKIGTGRMVVDSVVFGRYIASHIYFGDDPDPSLVEWELEKTGEDTGITWKFTAKGKYPLERMMLNMMKGGMEETGISKYLAGVPIATGGESSGDVMARSYPEIRVLMAMHNGPYEDLSAAYGKLMEYVETNQVGVKWESFEFYHTDPQTEPNVTKWKTLIAFPLK